MTASQFSITKSSRAPTIPPTSAGEDHLVGPVRRLAELAEAPRDQHAGGDEAEREHDPEGLQRERADVDLGLHKDAIAPAGIEPVISSTLKGSRASHYTTGPRARQSRPWSAWTLGAEKRPAALGLGANGRRGRRGMAGSSSRAASPRHWWSTIVIVIAGSGEEAPLFRLPTRIAWPDGTTIRRR